MNPDLKFKLSILIFVLSVIIYSNSLGGEFVYDDQYFVVKNINIKNTGNFGDFFTNRSAVAFAELSSDVYRPITALSYAIDYRLWKFDTFGYHLVNVLAHSANAVLVFLLLCMITGNIWMALLAGLFFAVHPVQTEAVSWISGRASVLFLFFYLIAFMLYIRFQQTKKKALFIYSLASYLVSLFSKEMAATLPLLLIAYDCHFSARERLKNYIYRYAPYLLLTVFFIFARAQVLQRVSQCGWWGGSPYYTFLTMARVMIDYVWILIAPVKLCAFYVINISRSIADLRVLASVTALTGTLISIPFLYKRSRIASFSILWFFITILPVSNIVPLRALEAERFLYLPSIGFCIGLAAFLATLRAKKTIAILLAVAIVTAYSIRTIERNKDWNDAVSISKSIIKVCPLNPWAYTSLGTAYLGRGLYDEAISSLKKAITLSRDYASPRNALGFCYLEMGRYKDAAVFLEDALKIKADNVETLNSLGTAYAQMGRYDDAKRQFEKAMKVDPTFIGAYLNLGAVYERALQDDKALELYEAIPSKTNNVPDVAVSYIRIADVYKKKGLADKASTYYQKALILCGNSYKELRAVIEKRIEKLHSPVPQK